MIHLEQRPFSGQDCFRPTPEVHVDPSLGLLIVATPWGDRSCARKTIDRMRDYLVLATGDAEATSPFPHLSCLSRSANQLRIASLLANDVLYREDNRKEYTAGVEIFACILRDDEFSWLQVGNPHIFLGRQGRMLVPIGSTIDLSFDISEGKKLLPPLPSQLLGLDTSVNPIINSFRARSGDRIILISHSQVPEAIYTSAPGATVDELGQKMSLSQPDSAFWLGVLSVDQVKSQEEAA